MASAVWGEASGWRGEAGAHAVVEVAAFDGDSSTVFFGELADPETDAGAQVGLVVKQKA
jgi:hypothetical protein